MSLCTNPPINGPLCGTHVKKKKKMVFFKEKQCKTCFDHKNAKSTPIELKFCSVTRSGQLFHAVLVVGSGSEVLGAILFFLLVCSSSSIEWYRGILAILGFAALNFRKFCGFKKSSFFVDFVCFVERFGESVPQS